MHTTSLAHLIPVLIISLSPSCHCAQALRRNVMCARNTQTLENIKDVQLIIYCCSITKHSLDSIWYASVPGSSQNNAVLLC